MPRFEVGQEVVISGDDVLLKLNWASNSSTYATGPNKDQPYRVGFLNAIGFTAAESIFEEWEAGNIASITLVYKGLFDKKMIDPETNAEVVVPRESFAYAGHVTFEQLTKLKVSQNKLKLIEAQSDLDIKLLPIKAAATAKLDEGQLRALLGLSATEPAKAVEHVDA